MFRSSDSLPRPTAVTITPDGDARAVYFTELGWVDGSKPALTRLDLEAGNVAEGAQQPFPRTAVVLTLAGAVVVCRPEFDAGEPRSCP